VSGRLTPRTQPLELERDPFQENHTIPTEWLTDDSVLPDLAAIEEQLSGQGQDGISRGSVPRQGAEGPAE
jgi:hypothetical protein